ncbi:MAG: hypothetical protein M5R36_17570 [Deltaproteobacteria bacterium]|nr:hypothetical protein [Deltaproteobacteria bacterium]
MSLFRVVHPAPDEAARGHARLSVDNAADLEFARTVHGALSKGGATYGAREIAQLLRERPDIRALNAHVRQKATDAKDLRVAFLIGHADQIAETLPKARELNERGHCGIVYLGDVDAATSELNALGYRVAPFAVSDIETVLPRALEENQIDVLLVDDESWFLRHGRTGLRVHNHRSPLPVIMGRDI